MSLQELRTSYIDWPTQQEQMLHHQSSQTDQCLHLTSLATVSAIEAEVDEWMTARLSRWKRLKVLHLTHDAVMGVGWSNDWMAERGERGVKFIHLLKPKLVVLAVENLKFGIATNLVTLKCGYQNDYLISMTTFS